MSEDDRVAWERRYAEGEYRARTWPSPFLDAWIDRLPRGKALDLACGAGRNALRLAEAGFQVEAVDISTSAIEMATVEAHTRGVDVAWRAADLDDIELTPAGYQVITMIRYMNRRLWPLLPSALAPGGWLLIEHHLQTTANVDGPPSEDFRLAPQELLEALGPLRIIFYEEVLEESDRDRSTYALARLVACKDSPGW